MRLRSLRIKNIRSYLDQEVVFPEGSLLLKGDIGAGKTTILYAIEFALFGLLKGLLSGEALLRQGKASGSVELDFEIEKEKIKIKRVLRRNRDRVEQSDAEIFITGNKIEKKNITPTEAKSFILDKFGYPKDLITKSKALIFRYTIYTPQEEMRKIIFEDPEIRLNVLRKVFDIEKYSRINENLNGYLKFLREESKELEGKIADLEAKKKNFEEKNFEFDALMKKINAILPNLKKAEAELKAKENEFNAIEAEVKKFFILEKNLIAIKEKLDSNKNALEQQNALIKNLDVEILNLKNKLEKIKFEKSFDSVEKLEKEIESKNQEIKKLNLIKRELETKLKAVFEIKEKISNLSKCPVCFQIVGEEHKKNICQLKNKEKLELEEEISNLNKKILEEEKNLEKLKRNFDELKILEKQRLIWQIENKNLEDKIKLKENFEKNVKNLEEEIKNLLLAAQDLESKLKEKEKLEKIFEEKKLEKNAALKAFHDLEVEFRALTEKKNLLENIILELKKEIDKKIECKKKLEKIFQIQNWISNFLISLINKIESFVMQKVLFEFNSYFEKWFNMLVGEALLSAKLDSSFAPIVQQNGYDVEIHHLSTGEKTALSLAYRLALNRIINEMITTIKTKDLLILDEPTDGFSSEQLDKMKEIIDELGASQIILVSHEEKLSSMVKNILEVVKEGHVSKVKSFAQNF